MPLRSLAGLALGLVVLSSSAAANPTSENSTTQTNSTREIFVAPGGTGDGSREAPLGHIQAALDAVRPGGVVTIAPGTYDERLRTDRAGTPEQPIVVRAAALGGPVVVTAPGLVLDILHPHVVIDGLVLDGQYGAGRTVDVRSAAAGTVLRNVEIRRSGRDCLRIRSTPDVLVEDSVIHRCLNPRDGRTDAHGVVIAAAQRLTIRNTEIHTFSGDAIQADPARSAPGWTDLHIDGCRLWLEPLRQEEHGFAPGVVPGENAIDTKTWPEGPRARLVITNTTAWGFRNGLISNQAAFNIKEQVDATVDAVTVYDSEIAFRVRGAGRRGPGARVDITNTVVYDVDVAVRHEDDIDRIAVWNSTIGLDVGQAFRAAESPRDRPDVRNLLVVADTLPPEADPASSLETRADVFLDASAGDYRLRADTRPIDRGTTLSSVTADRVGTRRPQGGGYDIGAYEHVIANRKP